MAIDSHQFHSSSASCSPTSDPARSSACDTSAPHSSSSRDRSPHDSRKRVMVLFGGQSSEHGISCATASGVLQAIDRSKYDVIPVGITRSGRWVLMEDTPERFAMTSHGSTFEVPEKDDDIVILPGTSRSLHIQHLFSSSSAYESTHRGFTVEDLGNIDVIFPLLHGAYGEDGTVQGLLEMTRAAYVGCGVCASAVCMDKHVTKVMLEHEGINVGHWQLLTHSQWQKNREQLRKKICDSGFPLFVKPCRAGSSVGISQVKDCQGIDAALEKAFSYDPRVIIEAQVDGLEVECAVLAGRKDEAPRVSIPGCIGLDSSAEFYDYETKYVQTQRIDLQIPAPISQYLTHKVQEIARQAFDCVQAEGLARIDFFVNPHTNSVILNEINTMPGFTPYSMYPALWRQAGMSYTHLVSELIEQALQRPRGLR